MRETADCIAVSRNLIETVYASHGLDPERLKLCHERIDHWYHEQAWTYTARFLYSLPADPTESGTCICCAINARYADDYYITKLCADFHLEEIGVFRYHSAEDLDRMFSALREPGLTLARLKEILD